jgi:predicted acyltransferase
MAGPPRGERLLSLDVFRGMTIAGMILVNNAGDWGHVYWPLDHAEWNGCTPTDLIFPFFVFIVGVAITLAFEKRRADLASDRVLLIQVARRTAILFALGVFLNCFPFTSPPLPARIPGVLQRIALVYFVVSILALKTRPITQLWIACLILVGYWYVLTHATPPDGDLDLSRTSANLGAWLDRKLLWGHLYHPPALREPGRWDPEGLLSTVPAIATGLSGVLAGRLLGHASMSAPRRIGWLSFAGAECAAVGLLWSDGFPFNKGLWTSSYVLWTSGLAMLGLGACYAVVDVWGVKAWSRPFVIFGKNAIAAFMLSHLFARVLVYGVRFEDGVSLKDWIYRHTFGAGGSTQLTSVGYAFTYLLIWLGIMGVMDRKKLYLKV